MAGSHNVPPDALERPLEVGPEDVSVRDFYQLMTALVIPRPIGWISTISAKGVRNRVVVVPGESHARMVLALSREDKTAGPAVLSFIGKR